MTWGGLLLRTAMHTCRVVVHGSGAGWCRPCCVAALAAHARAPHAQANVLCTLDEYQSQLHARSASLPRALSRLALGRWTYSCKTIALTPSAALPGSGGVAMNVRYA